MKKRLIIITASFAFGGIAFAALNSWLPDRVEIQDGVYQTSQNTLHKARESYEKAVKDELDAFCLLVDLKHADRIELSNPDSVNRYTNECPKVGPGME